MTIIDPRPISLPLSFEHLPVPLGEVDLCLSALVRAAVDRSAAKRLGEEATRFYDAAQTEYTAHSTGNSHLAALAEKLRQSQRPVIICGTDIVGEATPALAADQVLLLKAAQKEAGLFYVLPGANGFGAALLSSGYGSFLKVVEDVEKGAVTSLVVVESDPLRLFPDQQRLEQAFQRLEFLLVLDYLPSKTAAHAHIFLPTQTVFEAGGCFVNQEGRAQRALSIHRGGMSVQQAGAGDPPPRLFREDIPAGEPRAAWQTLMELAHILSPSHAISMENLWAALSRENPLLPRLESLEGQKDGVRLIPDQGDERAFSAVASLRVNQRRGLRDSMELLLVDLTFGTEELSGYSGYIHQVEKAPCLWMHAGDAAGCGLTDGDKVALSLDRGRLEVRLCLGGLMGRGVLVLPRHRLLSWQKLAAIPAGVRASAIRKVR